MTHTEMPIPAIYALSPGLLVLTIGVVFIILRIRFLRTARRVHGEVISIEERYPFGPFNSRGVRALPCYLPKVRFTTEDGVIYEFVDHSASRFLSSQVGKPIPVLYDPQNPRKACIQHWLTLWSRFVGIAVFGLVLLVFGIMIS
jgi:hypothetical protein